LGDAIAGDLTIGSVGGEIHQGEKGHIDPPGFSGEADCRKCLDAFGRVRIAD